MRSVVYGFLILSFSFATEICDSKKLFEQKLDSCFDFAKGSIEFKKCYEETFVLYEGIRGQYESSILSLRDSIKHLIKINANKILIDSLKTEFRVKSDKRKCDAVLIDGWKCIDSLIYKYECEKGKKTRRCKKHLNNLEKPESLKSCFRNPQKSKSSSSKP